MAVRELLITPSLEEDDPFYLHLHSEQTPDVSRGSSIPRRSIIPHESVCLPSVEGRARSGAVLSNRGNNPPPVPTKSTYPIAKQHRIPTSAASPVERWPQCGWEKTLLRRYQIRVDETVSALSRADLARSFTKGFLSFLHHRPEYCVISKLQRGSRWMLFTKARIGAGCRVRMLAVVSKTDMEPTSDSPLHTSRVDAAVEFTPE